MHTRLFEVVVVVCLAHAFLYIPVLRVRIAGFFRHACVGQATETKTFPVCIGHKA